MLQILFATTNDYKIEFANNLLNKHGWQVIPFEVDLVEPQSMSQTDISVYKAKQAYQQAKLPIMTMDSGLFIKALGGFPGIYTKDMFKMLKREDFLLLLNKKKDRTAYIQQTLSCADKDQIKTFSSKSEGTIVLPEEVVDGYAFDAFFKADVTGKLMAEMDEDEKGLVWGEAWHKLAEFLKSVE